MSELPPNNQNVSESTPLLATNSAASNANNNDIEHAIPNPNTASNRPKSSSKYNFILGIIIIFLSCFIGILIFHAYNRREKSLSANDKISDNFTNNATTTTHNPRFDVTIRKLPLKPNNDKREYLA